MPRFVADFDSSTGLVRALAAALRDERHLRLGRSRPAGLAVRASAALPEKLRARAFARAGGFEAIPPARLVDVDPEDIASWVASMYPAGGVGAVAIGSSNGAVMHLCAATGIPWLPQTFLVPVRRNADPDDCRGDVHLAERDAARLVENQPALQIHQMHDPNQDRLMVRRLAYFRMKLRALPASYRAVIRERLVPGGTIIIVNCGLRWPATRLGPNHVYQAGAVGGLEPADYVQRWDFPPIDDEPAEAEWGYEPALTEDVRSFARDFGYRLVELRFPQPEAISPVIADLFHDWYATAGELRKRLLAETFICVEPTWALRTRTVPLWLTFGTQPSLRTLTTYLRKHPDYADVLVTLFAHGVRSVGYAPASDWRRTTGAAGQSVRLVGVHERQWPADFATLVNYSRSLYRLDSTDQRLPAMPLSFVANGIVNRGAEHGVEWLCHD